MNYQLSSAGFIDQIKKKNSMGKKDRNEWKTTTTTTIDQVQLKNKTYIISLSFHIRIFFFLFLLFFFSFSFCLFFSSFFLKWTHFNIKTTNWIRYWWWWRWCNWISFHFYLWSIHTFFLLFLYQIFFSLVSLSIQHSCSPSFFFWSFSVRKKTPNSYIRSLCFKKK